MGVDPLYQGKRIAITGAAGEIGRSIMARLASRGAQVYALDRRVPEQLPDRARALSVDLLDEASIQRALQTIYEESDEPVDLVTCAGVVEDDVAAEGLETALFDAVMGVNFRSVFLCCREFGQQLLERGGGRIVNVSSMSGNAIVNYPQRQSIYNSSKAAVSALTRSLAVEWGPRGVQINAISPGYVDTALNALKADMHAQWLQDTPLGRFATPDEIASAVEFLLSDAAAFCLGSELLIDGGYSLR